jgi:hypothetical protein
LRTQEVGTMGYGGGGSDVLQAMMRDVRREEARREARRARRQARRQVVRLQRELDAADPDWELDERWPFACALLCGACGYLRFPSDYAASHPLRRTASPSALEHSACPACRRLAWIDLANKAMARAVVDAEVFEHDLARSRRSTALTHLGFGSFVGMFGAVALSFGAPAVGVAALGLSAAQWGIAIRSWRARPRRRTLPRRWSMCPAPIEPKPWRQDALSQGETSSSPLTGRACLAYEVLVCWQGLPVADVGSWALVEQRLGALVVGGSALPTKRTYLRLGHDRVDLQALGVSERAQHWLRARGLDPADGAFDVYETILEPGATVHVLRSGELYELRRSSDAEPATRHAKLEAA